MGVVVDRVERNLVEELGELPLVLGAQADELPELHAGHEGERPLARAKPAGGRAGEPGDRALDGERAGPRPTPGGWRARRRARRALCRARRRAARARTGRAPAERGAAGPGAPPRRGRRPGMRCASRSPTSPPTAGGAPPAARREGSTGAGFRGRPAPHTRTIGACRRHPSIRTASPAARPASAPARLRNRGWRSRPPSGGAARDGSRRGCESSRRRTRRGYPRRGARPPGGHRRPRPGQRPRGGRPAGSGAPPRGRREPRGAAPPSRRSSGRCPPR